MYEELIRLLQEFGSDAAVIELIQRFATRDDEGVEALSDDELQTVRDALIALASDDEASAALLNAAVGCVADVRGEETVRAEQVSAEEAERAAAVAALQGDTPTEPDETEEEGEAEAEPADADASTETVEAEPEPVAASAAPARASRQALARRRPPAAAPQEEHTGPNIQFAAGVPDRMRGERTGSLAELDRSIVNTWDTMSRGQSPVDQVAVARISVEYPEERRLVDSAGRQVPHDIAIERVENAIRSRVELARTGQSVTAAGGLCAPLTPYYGVETLGDDRRPIRDTALVSFQAARGGIISVVPPRLVDLAGSVGVWTVADDASATDGSPTKPIIRVDCGDQRTTSIEAVTARIQFGNMISRTFGEYTTAFSELSMVAHARLAEQELFDAMVAASDAADNATQIVSAYRDVLTTLDAIATSVRSKNRTARNFPFRVVLPETLLAAIRTDVARALPGGSLQENLTWADAGIEASLRSRNISVTWSPDIAIMDEQGDGDPVVDLPGTVPYVLYPEGTFLFLDAGMLDIGPYRDNTLVGINDFATFVETFEGLHFLGVKSVTGTIDVCPSGAVSGTIDPGSICAAFS